MLTNAAIMSLKAFRPVYILPTDYKESVVYTKLPNGKELKLRVRKEEADQVRKLETMDDMHVTGEPSEDAGNTFGMAKNCKVLKHYSTLVYLFIFGREARSKLI